MASNNDSVNFWTGKDRTFSDPFLLPSNNSIPTDPNAAHDMCLYLYYLNPLYRRASIRVISHFITDVDFEGKSGDEDEKRNFKDFLISQLNIFGMMSELGQEFAAYGNGFCRIHFPFDRILIDKRGGKYREYALSPFGMDAKYHYKDMVYEIPDPETLSLPLKERKTVKLPFLDRPSTDWSKIKLRKINPKYVTLRHSHMSGKKQILYRFESWFIKAIQDGVLYQVNETPMAMLKAISKDQDFLFKDDQVFHFSAPSISGVSDHGWGAPETIANFRYLHQLQVYRKIDEAVGMDYMLPFRLFSPNIGTNNSDASLYTLFGTWTQHIKKIIDNRRKDPFAIHSLPFPVTYQEMGAEGKNLSPKDLIEFQTNDMLDAMGYPAELFRGSMQVQQIPTALRLFENSFYFIYQNFNNFLKWVASKVLAYTNQEDIGVSLKLPSMADDLEQRSIYLQLAAGQEIPRDVAYRPFGIKDPVEAAKRRAEEDIEIERERAKIQKDFEREMSMGSMDDVIMAGQQQGAPGSAPAAGGGDPNASGGLTPLDIQDRAMQEAQELVTLPPGESRKRLAELKATNPTLYASVKQFMEEIRSDSESQGRASLRQQPPPQ